MDRIRHGIWPSWGVHRWVELFELGQTALGRIPHWGGSFRGWSIHVDTFRCWCGSKLSMCVCIKYVCIYSEAYSYLFVYYSLPKNMALHVQHGNWCLFIPVQQFSVITLRFCRCLKWSLEAIPVVYIHVPGLCVSMVIASIALVIPFVPGDLLHCMFVFLHSALLGLGSNCILHISYQFIS